MGFGVRGEWLARLDLDEQGRLLARGRRARGLSALDDAAPDGLYRDHGAHISRGQPARLDLQVGALAPRRRLVRVRVRVRIRVRVRVRVWVWG